ncbi:glycosyltransferase 87 family protein, partial [candidate division CSSED10-310 bacterium]
MAEDTKKKATILLFLLLYVPFLYRYGWLYFSKGSIDFPTFYCAAQASFSKNVSPYDYYELSKIEPEIGHRYPYLYPPPSLLIFYPCTFLSYDHAKDMMLIINHVSILLFMYLFFFKILDLNFSQTHLTLWIVYVLIFSPLVITLHHGQVNLVILVLLLKKEKM